MKTTMWGGNHRTYRPTRRTTVPKDHGMILLLLQQYLSTFLVLNLASLGDNNGHHRVGRIGSHGTMTHGILSLRQNIHPGVMNQAGVGNDPRSGGSLLAITAVAAAVSDVHTSSDHLRHCGEG